jgi:DNA (cytosine-5)-methyltransferase 3A
VSTANYPDIIRLGDVKNVKGADLPTIDLILAGSPCQGFSHNGSKRGFDDPRSRLFWEFVRLVEECKPTWFLLENVRMKKEWADIISEAVGCQPIVLNSALVSAQRRMRYYWTNIPYDGAPADKGIVLKDILERPIADDQPMTDAQGKCYCLTATYSRCGNAETGMPYQSDIVHNTARHQRTCVMVAGKSIVDNYNGQGNRVYSPDGKMATLGKSAPKVQIGGSGEGAQVAHNDKPVINREDWRMLTPIECERLQTLPDNYTAAVSKSQRYKCLGNGWTVDIIAHLIGGIG